MTDLEALAKLASEDARLWAGYGRGDGKNDADYLVEHTKYQQAASPDVVLALVRVALAAEGALPVAWVSYEGDSWFADNAGIGDAEGKLAALQDALADLDR
ncbi:MAG TPA: hypothetical protein VII01_03990 [Solirubrobacteraceae bacterium]